MAETTESRTISTIVMVVVAAAAIWWFFLRGDAPLLAEQAREEQQRADAEAALNRLQDAVVVDLRWETELCPIEQPVLVLVRNTSTEVVTAISFEIVGYQAQHSEAVTEPRPFSSDRIVTPGDQWLVCSDHPYVPTNGQISPADLDWRVSLKTVTFDLQSVNSTGVAPKD
jgi:hypothetical protein